MTTESIEMRVHNQ